MRVVGSRSEAVRRYSVEPVAVGLGFDPATDYYHRN